MRSPEAQVSLSLLLRQPLVEPYCHHLAQGQHLEHSETCFTAVIWLCFLPQRLLGFAMEALGAQKPVHLIAASSSERLWMERWCLEK